MDFLAMKGLEKSTRTMSLLFEFVRSIGVWLISNLIRTSWKRLCWAHEFLDLDSTKSLPFLCGHFLRDHEGLCRNIGCVGHMTFCNEMLL